MFIEDIYKKDNKYFNKLARESCTFNAFYIYWRDNLFERVMRLFVWNTGDDLLPKEIEQRLILAGHCGITSLPKETALTAMFGSFSGPTKYIDEFTKYTVRCPIYTGVRTIGKDVAVIDNTKLRNPIYPLIHHYACLLAHSEVTFIDVLVNARDASGVPVATSEIQKQSIQDYQAKKFNGQFSMITDLAGMGSQFYGVNTGSAQNVTDLQTVRDQLLKQFYSDIGVRSAFVKRSNAIQEEVEADTGLLMLNLSDMLECRKQGAEKVNDLYGTSWTVDIAEEIKAALEYDEAEEEEEDETNV